MNQFHLFIVKNYKNLGSIVVVLNIEMLIVVGGYTFNQVHLHAYTHPGHLIETVNPFPGSWT